jgi:hypothetical protein
MKQIVVIFLIVLWAGSTWGACGSQKTYQVADSADRWLDTTWDDTLRVVIHSFARNDGTSQAVDTTDIHTTMDSVTQLFRAGNIAFKYQIDIIHSNYFDADTISTDVGVTLQLIYYYIQGYYSSAPSSCYNIFIVPAYAGLPGYGSFGLPDNYATSALSYYGGGWLSEGTEQIPQIITHELGHSMGLYHTQAGVDANTTTSGITPTPYSLCNDCVEHPNRDSATARITGDFCYATKASKGECDSVGGVDTCSGGGGAAWKTGSCNMMGAGAGNGPYNRSFCNEQFGIMREALHEKKSGLLVPR